jgi:hypothetical protein
MICQPVTLSGYAEWPKVAGAVIKADNNMKNFSPLFILVLFAYILIPNSVFAVPCSPTNYTKIKNTEPLPADFCAYAYFPYRARMPENAQHIDQESSQILQNVYAPNSSADKMHATNFLWTRETASGDNGAYPVYIAGPNDPLVSVNCSNTNYGCSDADYNKVSSMPKFRVPAFARPSAPSGHNDADMEIIQPNGDTVAFYQCRPQRDWRDGDVLGDASSICGYFSGASYGHIVTSAGVNPGNVNGGNNFAALPVHFQEVMHGQINHALVVWSGCFIGTRYPSKYPALTCNNPPGIPSGSHIWLSLTRAQIDAQPTSVIPAHMRVFAYAAHEYGMYTMDTGDGKKWFGQPALEDALPYLLSGGGDVTYWKPWFDAHGGTSGGTDLKMYGKGNIIDWSALAQYLYVVDECYSHGTCSDSVPEGTGPSPTPTRTPTPQPTPAGTPCNVYQNGVVF